MKVLVKIGGEKFKGIEKKASVTVNGKPIEQVLKAEEKPERETVQDGNNTYGVWTHAAYRLSVGQVIRFVSTVTGKEDIVGSFVVGDIGAPTEIDGHTSTCHSDMFGWLIVF